MVYEYLLGDEVQSKAFETNGCEIAPAIEELGMLVGDLGADYVADCSAAVLGIEDDESEVSDQEEDDQNDLADSE